MKYLNRLVAVALAAFFFAGPALAQNNGTVTNHAFALGAGPGGQGYTSLLCGATQLAVGQSAADPICRTLTGDVTLSAAGVTAIGTAKVVQAMIALNAVDNTRLAQMANGTIKCRTTAGTGNPEDCTGAQIRTLLALVIGTNVEAWDADLDCLAALSGTGIVRRTGAGTCSTGTAIANSELATMPAYTLKGNATGSTATPTDIDVTALTSKASPVTSDIVLIQDSAASNAFKKTTVGALSSAGSVASYNGRTGSVTAIGTDVPIRSYLAGLTLSTAGSSSTFGIAVGVATNSTNVSMMALASAYTKTTSAWTLGTAVGSLDTGTIANSTWYHVYLIQRPDTGVVDVLVSLSATAPTLPTNYTLFRRIGSMKTNASAQWTAFLQTGDKFRWMVGINDITSTNPGTSAVLRTLMVPTGIKVEAELSVDTAALSSTALFILITDPDETDSIPGSSVYTLIVSGPAAGNQAGSQVRVTTNTSAQIRTRFNVSGVSDTITATTSGWIDRRGRDN